jgi:hypothetical protein
MFMLDVEGRFATHDVIGQVKDLLEGEVGLVEPGAVRDRSRRFAKYSVVLDIP